MKTIIFDPNEFINKFNKEIDDAGIKVPKGTLNTIVSVAKNKFSNKYYSDVILALTNFNDNNIDYKHFCKIIPYTGELGYEIINCKTNQSVFSLVYSGFKLPDVISAIDDVKDFIIKETSLDDLSILRKALLEVYSNKISFIKLSKVKYINLIYEYEVLYCRINNKVEKMFYIPEVIFDLGINPNFNKYLNLSIDDYEIENKTLNDFPTIGFDCKESLFNRVTSTLNLSKKEFIHVISKLIYNGFYQYKNYSFSVDCLFIPALVIQTRKENSLISLERFVLTIDLLKELFIEICNFNKVDNNGLNTFQLAEELVDVLDLPKQHVFKIFSEVTLAIIENETNLLDNYKLYIYAKEGKALLYYEDTLIEEFAINKKLFNGIRIDYYHYLSNF